MIGTNKSFLWDQQSRLVFRLWTELDRLRTCVCPGPCIKPTRTRHSLRLRTRVRTIGQRLVMWKPVKRRNDWKPRTSARTNFGRACPSISKYEIFGPILRFNLYLKWGQIWVKILGSEWILIHKSGLGTRIVRIAFFWSSWFGARVVLWKWVSLYYSWSCLRLFLHVRLMNLTSYRRPWFPAQSYSNLSLV